MRAKNMWSVVSRVVTRWVRPSTQKKPSTSANAATSRGITDDPSDPGLRKVREDGQQEKYLVLSDAERDKGFVRPVRYSYFHTKCGGVTTMGTALSETYARDPKFYSGTYCAHCRTHFPVGEHGEFYWNGTDEKVGT